MDKEMKQRFYSLLYRALIKTVNVSNKYGFTRKLWNSVWKYSADSYVGNVSLRLHSESVLLNNGNMYPLFKKQFYTLNLPIVELVHLLFKAQGRKIDVIDVGAAFGDTMLLVNESCPGMVNKFYCIDGDPEFFELLKFNLRNFKNAILINALLSDKDSFTEKKLVRTHSGTASSQGKEATGAKTLDALIVDDLKAGNIDLLKIDVDGLDGKVIGGSSQILEKFRPVVIFEWHPILYDKTGNSFSKPFSELTRLEYNRFVFFDKFGNFSHVHYNISEDEIHFSALLCMRNKFSNDWHYDVIALHKDAKIDPVDIAEMKHARQ